MLTLAVVCVPLIRGDFFGYDVVRFLEEGHTMIKFVVNGKEAYSEQPGDTPLLWVMRDELGLTGTKFGCGIGAMRRLHGARQRQSGARLRHAGVRRWRARRSRPSKGLAPAGDHPLQKAWIAEQVPQCGYCQSGQIMQAAALLAKNKKPTREQIVQPHERQPLPLRHLQRHRARHPARREGGLAMKA